MATAKRAPKGAGKKTGKRATSKPSDASKVVAVAKRDFQFESLRPGQKEAIQSVLDRHDTLVVMPTGAGKSAIYQIAGRLVNGVTLIISPLIALQKDQVDSINELTDGDAVVVNSTQRVAETREAFTKIEEGEGKYVFLAPEQLHKSETVEALERAGVALFVVDEAHCISEWGHDFRPDYLQLGAMAERLGSPVTLAMTATASAQVREEIIQRLRLREPKVFVHGFDRPNIYLRVDHFAEKDQKREALLHRVRWAQKPGIIYVATRKNAEEIMGLLADEGIEALFYHGGLKASERHAIQEKFMGGEAEVIVATNAFGMGIDKADVRFVYHYDASESLDSYYQEIGRAGRDGEKAEAVLFFRQEDMGIQNFHASEGKLAVADVERVIDVIAGQEGPVELEEISEQVNLSDRKLNSAVRRLEDVGAVEVLSTGEVQVAEEADVAEAAEAAAAEQERRKQMKQERLRRFQEYADASSCRREHLLSYFGDEFTGPCGNCDNCEAGTPGIKVDSDVGTRREVA